MSSKGAKVRNVYGAGHPRRNTPTHSLAISLEMDVEAEGGSVKIKELEKQVAALKKENTKLKNEMRFNLDQEKYISL